MLTAEYSICCNGLSPAPTAKSRLMIEKWKYSTFILQHQLRLEIFQDHLVAQLFDYMTLIMEWLCSEVFWFPKCTDCLKYYLSSKHELVRISHTLSKPQPLVTSNSCSLPNLMHHIWQPLWHSSHPHSSQDQIWLREELACVWNCVHLSQILPRCGTVQSAYECHWCRVFLDARLILLGPNEQYCL